MQKRLEKYEKDFNSFLSSEYPVGHTVFGVTKANMMVPYGKIPYGFDIDWHTAKVILQTNEIVKIKLPSIRINYNGLKNILLRKITMALPKKLGATSSHMYAFEDFALCLRIIGIDINFIAIGLGFKKIKP